MTMQICHELLSKIKSIQISTYVVNMILWKLLSQATKLLLSKRMKTCNSQNVPISVFVHLISVSWLTYWFHICVGILRRCPVDDSVQFVHSSDLKERKFSVKADDFLNNLPQVNRIFIIILNSLISQNCMLRFKFFQNIFLQVLQRQNDLDGPDIPTLIRKDYVLSFFFDEKEFLFCFLHYSNRKGIE